MLSEKTVQHMAERIAKDLSEIDTLIERYRLAWGQATNAELDAILISVIKTNSKARWTTEALVQAIAQYDLPL